MSYTCPLLSLHDLNQMKLAPTWWTRSDQERQRRAPPHHAAKRGRLTDTIRHRRHRASFVLSLVCLSLLLFSAGQAAPLRGTIKLPANHVERGRILGFWLVPNTMLEILPPLVDPREKMVVLIEGSTAAASSIQPVITMEDLRLSPSVLPVHPQTAITFVNKDPMLHLLEPVDGTFMTVKRIAAGSNVALTLPKAGTYQYRCSEHPHMVGTILVIKSGQFTVPDNKGGFSFADLAPGAYTLRIWHQGKWIHSQPLAIKGRTTVEVVLPPLSVQEKE